jgi:hypothetical protein
MLCRKILRAYNIMKNTQIKTDFNFRLSVTLLVSSVVERLRLRYEKRLTQPIRAAQPQPSYSHPCSLWPKNYVAKSHFVSSSKY